MTIQTFQKVLNYVQAAQFMGGRESGMEICKWIGSGSAYIPATNKDPFDYVQVPTMFGPRDIEEGDWAVKIDSGTIVTYKSQALMAEYVLVEDEEQNLIKHARRELALFPDEEADYIESIINTVKAFCSYRGHSGASASIAVQMVTALLNGNNLMPLTNDPDEWELRAGKDYGLDYDMWQNVRNSKALSMDGGSTYFIVGEAQGDEKRKYYVTEDKDFNPEIDPDDLLSMDEKYERTSCSVPGHPMGRVDEESMTFYCAGCEAAHPLERKEKTDGSDLS